MRCIELFFDTDLDDQFVTLSFPFFLLYFYDPQLSFHFPIRLYFEKDTDEIKLEISLLVSHDFLL